MSGSSVMFFLEQLPRKLYFLIGACHPVGSFGSYNYIAFGLRVCCLFLLLGLILYYEQRLCSLNLALFCSLF